MSKEQVVIYDSTDFKYNFKICFQHKHITSCSTLISPFGVSHWQLLWDVTWSVFSCVCRLPFPWLLWSFLNNMKPVQVSSNGLFCAIVLLFLMLLFVIVSIAACKWRMSKLLGFIMFMLYFVFLVVSVMLEDKVISCPVSVWWTWLSLRRLNPSSLTIQPCFLTDVTFNWSLRHFIPGTKELI